MATEVRKSYVALMKYKALFSKTRYAGLALGVVLVGLAVGCVERERGPHAVIYPEPDVYAIQDDYVYYPDFECYYSVRHHQYAYYEGNRWVARPAPRGVSIAVLERSPSVRMDFHDSPAYHHSEVARQYPKNWRPAGAKPDPHEKADRRNQSGDKHER